MPIFALADADLEVEDADAYWVAPTAVLIGRIVLKKNASVWFGAVLFDQAGRQSPPAYVERVTPASPAAKLGLRNDDLLVSIDDFSIRTCREFHEILGKYAPGQKVKVTWKRGTQVMTGDVELAKEPAK